MSVIPFVCCARRQGLAVSRARYQTIYNTAVDYTELKGRKRQCAACDRVRELVHLAPCIRSCRAGRGVSFQWLVGLLQQSGSLLAILSAPETRIKVRVLGYRCRGPLERRQRRENSKQTGSSRLVGQRRTWQRGRQNLSDGRRIEALRPGQKRLKEIKTEREAER